jgi:hypothetical protein
VRAIPRFIEPEFLVELLLPDIGQDQDAPAMEGLAIFAVDHGGRKLAMLSWYPCIAIPSIVSLQSILADASRKLSTANQRTATPRQVPAIPVPTPTEANRSPVSPPELRRISRRPRMPRIIAGIPVKNRKITDSRPSLQLRTARGLFDILDPPEKCDVESN